MMRRLPAIDRTFRRRIGHTLDSHPEWPSVLDAHRGTTLPGNVLPVSGELDIATVPALLAAGYALLARDPYLVLDMRRTRFADLLGVEALMALHRRAESLGGALAIVGARPAVSWVIVLAGYAETLDLQHAEGTLRAR